MPVISGAYPQGFTVPAGETWEFSSGTVTVGNTTGGTPQTRQANVVVLGTLKIRGSGNVAAPSTLKFLGIDESTFVGGGLVTTASDPLITNRNDPGIWVIGNGVLDIVGTAKTSWTRDPNSAVGWANDDDMWITPTDVDVFASRVWDFGLPIPQAYPGVPSAEVFNLSRDVLIEGSSATHRAHIYITAGQVQTLKYAGLRYMGPRFDPGTARGTDVVLGRWPIHFHNGFLLHQGSIVEGVAARDCGSHVFVAHLSHGVIFRDCVSYKNISSPYWWDEKQRTDDCLWEHLLAADTIVNGDASFAAAAFEFNFGSRNRAIDCVAAATAGGGNSAGFKWSLAGAEEDGVDSGSWEMRGCVAHNQRNGIFWWQNTRNTHETIDFTAYNNGETGKGGFGADVGAYRNAVHFTNPTFRGNLFSQHAAGGDPVLGPAPRFYQGITGGTLETSPHSLELSGSNLPHDEPANGSTGRTADWTTSAPFGPTLYQDVAMSTGVSIAVSSSSQRYFDFVRCLVAGRDLEQANFFAANPGTNALNYVIRVQRRDRTAFRFGLVNNVAFVDSNIPPFAAEDTPVPPPPGVGTFSLVGSVTASVAAAADITPDFSGVVWAVNDVAIAFLAKSGSAGAVAPDPPAGWTRIWNLGSVVGSARHSVLYGRVLAAGEDTTPTFPLPGNSGDATLILSIWRGVLANWGDVAETVTADQNSANPTNPAISTVTDKAAVIVMGHITHAGLTAMGPPTGFTAVNSRFLLNANSLMSYQVKDPAGTVTPGPWNNIGGASSNDYTLVSYALRTAPAAPGGTIGRITGTSFAFPVTLAAAISRVNHFEEALPVTLRATTISLVAHFEEAFEVTTRAAAPPIPVLVTEAILSSFAVQIAVGLELLDENDVLLADISTNFLGGVVARNMNATIHGTARLRIAQTLNWHNQRLRPYLVATELVTGAFERFDLGIYLPETPSRSGNLPDTYDVEAYDKLVILDHPHGVAATALAGTRVVTKVEELLNDRGLPHLIDQSSAATVPSTQSWPLDSQNTTLRIVNDLLASINYRALYVDRNGIFRSEAYQPPQLRAPVFHYDASSPRTIIGEQITEEIDLFTIPNWWVFIRDDPAQPAPVEGDGLYTVINAADGITSIASRGRTINKVVRLEAADQASLVALGNQIVQQDRQPSAHLEFSAVPNPHHWHADSVTVTSDELGLGAVVFGEQSWSLPLDGSDMSHRVRRSVQL